MATVVSSISHRQSNFCKPLVKTTQTKTKKKANLFYENTKKNHVHVYFSLTSSSMTFWILCCFVQMWFLVSCFLFLPKFIMSPMCYNDQEFSLFVHFIVMETFFQCTSASAMDVFSP